MENYINGFHQCFYCGNGFEWEATIEPIRYQARTRPEVEASVEAVGRENDGSAKFEFVAICPKCRIKNRFTR